MEKSRRMLIAGIGLIMFAIGTIGALLPVMPTVPFYLVAAFCFAKSSERLDNWFRNTQLYKKTIGTFIVGRQMSLWLKILLTLAGTVCAVFAFLFCIDRKWTAPAVVVCILWVEMIVYLFFIIKTKRKFSDERE